MTLTGAYIGQFARQNGWTMKTVVPDKFGDTAFLLLNCLSSSLHFQTWPGNIRLSIFTHV